MLPGGYQQQYAFPPAGAPFPGHPSPHGSAAHAGAYYGAPQPPYGAQTMPGYGYPQDPYGRGMPPGAGPAPGMMSEREHERATKDWQKQMKQSQKEAEKRARKEAKEAEKFKAQWEKGERERQKAEEKEARELERARARDRERGGSVASSGHQRSVSAAVPGMAMATGAVPGAIPPRERKLSNAMGFDKYGDTLAGQMDALSLGGTDPSRRERRTSTAGPPPPGVGTAGRARRYSNAGYDRGDPYAPPADSAAAYDRRAAAAQQAQDDAYARAASNAYYVQGERAGPGSAVGDPAGPPPLAGAASQSMWDPRGRERDYARDRGARERDYAGREAEDPYAPAPPGAYPSGASRSPYEDPMRAAPGSNLGHPPAVDPYAAAGAPAYAHNAPYAAGGAAPGAYGAAPPVPGAHHSPSGYAPAITPSHSPYARDPALGAGVPGAPAAHDPYASNSSYYGAAGASRYGAASGYAGAQDRSPYGAAAQGPPPLTSAVPGAAAGAYAYSSRSSHDPYAAATAAPAPYGGASRSPYDRHSAPPAPRGDPYAPVPGASVGAYGQQPPSPYDRIPPPPAAGAYGASGAYGAAGRAPSPLPYGAAAGARAPSPLPYGAAASGRTPSPLPYPRHAAQAFAQHAQDGDPTLGLGGRNGPPSPYERDPYGQGHGMNGRGGYEAEAEPMPSSPPGFHRQPSQSHKYTPFEAFLILDDLDGFYRETPHMPAALVSHDVFHEDWIRFMQDLAFAWSGRIPAPELGRDGRQPHHGAIVADLVDVWNMRFFHPRRVELIVYHGRAPVSGRRGAPADEDDYSSRKWSLCLRCLSGGHSAAAAAGFPPGGMPPTYA